MGVTYTEEQQKVIDTRDKSMLVSAAAGSGKTAVLVERIVKLVSDSGHPVDIDRILVVTFTNAAAAQMRERIRDAIGDRLAKEPENEHLQKQMTLLHNAQITTIDSFCLFVIRNHFHTIGLDPGFRIADEGELKLLRADVLGEVIEKQYGLGEEAFLNCMEYFSTGSRDKAVEDAVLKLYDFAMSNPFPEEWLKERSKDYICSEEEQPETAVNDSGWMKRIMERTGLLLEGLLRRIGLCIAICEEADGPYMYGGLLDREKEKVERLAAADSYEKRYKEFATLFFDRLPSKKDDTVSDKKRELVKNVRTEVKEQLQTIQKKYFANSLEEIAKQSEVCGEAVRGLADLTCLFKEAFDAAKRDKNMLDFDDIEHFALSILLSKGEDGEIIPTDTALEYREHFEEILIDEYQDSNLVQEYLLSVISREADGDYNRFMVGDVKQSIYKFRLARPEIFMEKYDAYEEESENTLRIDLHKNFRSRNEVLTSTNAVFSQVMIRELGGICYDERAALYPGASYSANDGSHENDTELLLYITKEEEEEAYGVAVKIKQLVGSFQVTDEDTGLPRKASYRDIVILLRSTSGHDEKYRSILEQEGIPAHVTSKTGYFAAAEVQELLHFLRVLDNSIQDIPLYGVMHSVFGGFSEEEIAMVKSAFPKKRSLYDTIVEFLRAGEDKELCLKLQCFMDRIEQYRDMAVYMPVHELLQEIIKDYSYSDYVSAKPGGLRRRANVEMLLTKAEDYEKTSYYGLYHFLRYIEQLEKYDVDYGEASLQDENMDVVRIMSIHKSKGLEFPICFVSGLGKGFNNRDANAHPVMDVEEGIGVDYVNPSMRIIVGNLRRSYIADKLKQDNLAEELRILYVAMTRAKEKLILTGAVKNPEKMAESLSLLQGCKDKSFSFDILIQMRSFMDVLLYAVARNQCFDRVWEMCGKQPDSSNPLYKEQTGIQVSVLQYDDAVIGSIKETIDRDVNKRRLTSGVMEYETEGLEGEFMEKVNESFSYRYPHECLKDLYSKTTVSELKKAGMKEENDFSFSMYDEETIVPYLPKFIKHDDIISGTDRGSAYHKVMELFDFKLLLKTRDEEELKKLVINGIDGMIDSGKIPQTHRDIVSVSKILTFLQSDIAGRMAEAAANGKLYKEQPFVLGLPASRLNEMFPEEETVLIQGIIDAFFEEDGRYVVVDYKTDAVKTQEELIKRYKTQLDYYAEALEQLMGNKMVDIKSNTEKIIYSFGLGIEIAL